MNSNTTPILNTKTKRLLCIVGSMNAGGAETFLMKVYRSLDKSKYQMDFYTMSSAKGVYEDEIVSLGGRVFHSIPKSKNFIKSFIMLANTVNKENYKYVMRVSEHSLSTLDLIAAKLGGSKHIIFRSSNSKVTGGKTSMLLHNFFRLFFSKIPTLKIAPSTEAAEFMFGKDCILKKEAIILKNAILLKDFSFKEEIRIKIRTEFNLEGKFLIGHVGRFNSQKNHDFLIRVFHQLYKKHPNSMLMLVGEGELENQIKTKVKELGLEDKVIFTGVRADIANLMMAMDVYVFPSFFEGMPNTVIEAQATGLPCIISDSITKESKITNLVQFLPINDWEERWVKEILKHKNSSKRNNVESEFRQSGYDIQNVVRSFENLIFERKIR